MEVVSHINLGAPRELGPGFDPKMVPTRAVSCRRYSRAARMQRPESTADILDEKAPFCVRVSECVCLRRKTSQVGMPVCVVDMTLSLERKEVEMAWV